MQILITKHSQTSHLFHNRVIKNKFVTSTAGFFSGVASRNAATALVQPKLMKDLENANLNNIKTTQLIFYRNQHSNNRFVPFVSLSSKLIYTPFLIKPFRTCQKRYLKYEWICRSRLCMLILQHHIKILPPRLEYIHSLHWDEDMFSHIRPSHWYLHQVTPNQTPWSVDSSVQQDEGESGKKNRPMQHLCVFVKWLTLREYACVIVCHLSLWIFDI